MTKFIKIFSVISVVLCGVAVLLSVAFLTFLWEPMAEMLNFQREIIRVGPTIPLTSIVALFSSALFAISVLATLKTGKGVAIEILIIIFICLIPFLNYFLGTMQTLVVGRFSGDVALASLGSTSSVLNMIPLKLAELSKMLSLLICGMRIGEKRFYKNKQELM